jgi:hypothetical protein
MDESQYPLLSSRKGTSKFANATFICCTTAFVLDMNSSCLMLSSALINRHVGGRLNYCRCSEWEGIKCKGGSIDEANQWAIAVVPSTQGGARQGKARRLETQDVVGRSLSSASWFASLLPPVQGLQPWLVPVEPRQVLQEFYPLKIDSYQQ